MSSVEPDNAAAGGRRQIVEQSDRDLQDRHRSRGAARQHKAYVTSVEDFKQALLAAKVLVYADPVRGGAAGVHIAKVLQRLGISEQLKAQITLGAGGDVTEVTIAQGNGALGMTQISEIVGKSTAEYVGPLPAELQNYTVFIGGVPSGSMPSDALTALITFLKSPTALAAIEAKGMRVD